MAFFNPQSRRDFESALRKWQWLSTVRDAEIEKVQWESLRRVWADCVNDVIYYHNLVQKGMAPRELRSWQDLRNIPVLERSALQAKQDEFCRLSGAPEEYRMSGGSTGTPVRLGVRKREATVHRVAKLMLWQRAGYTPSDRLFLLWGHLHLLGTGARGRFNHHVRKLKDWLLDYRRADAYALSPDKCAEIARALLKHHPFGLIGYASALDYFVRVTEPFHEAFGRLGLRFVMPAGEMPPRADSYELLTRVFHCPVIEEYGGVEFGQVAMRHEPSGFVVFHDLNYVESHATPGDANQERLLVTSLYDRYVPLVRYAPGDEISGPRRLPNGHVASFARVKGRIHDSVHLADGVVIHSMAMLHCIHQEPSVMNIQLLLQDAGPRLRLAVGAGFDAACEQRIRRRLADVAPGLFQVAIDRVADVATTVAGKRRWIRDERTSSSR